MHVASSVPEPLGDQLNSTESLALFVIKKCIRTTSTATAQVLDITLTLDLQVGKLQFCARGLRLNCNAEIRCVEIRATEIQLKAKRWKVHSTMSQS